jgi:hypothetical protein
MVYIINCPICKTDYRVSLEFARDNCKNEFDIDNKYIGKLRYYCINCFIDSCNNTGELERYKEHLILRYENKKETETAFIASEL